MESDRETRERLRLVAAIKDELAKQETLKNAILHQLGQGSGFQRVAQHPALLVVLTFVLTTLVGSCLTSRWQRAEQANQALLQSKQRAFEQKYLVANETAKSIGEIHAATTAVLATLQIENIEMRTAELLRIVPKWRDTKNEWVVNQAVITGKIAANFPHQSDIAIKEFDEIFYSYKRVNVAIGNMLEQLQGSNQGWDSTQADIKNYLETINNETREKTKALIEQMTRQLNAN